MAVSKADTFSEEEKQLAAWAKALGHPARIAILKVLAQRDMCICGEIVDELPLAQATVSQHLKALKQAGLVTGQIDGPRSCYCLHYESLRRCKAAFGALFGEVVKRTDCC